MPEDLFSYSRIGGFSTSLRYHLLIQMTGSHVNVKYVQTCLFSQEYIEGFAHHIENSQTVWKSPGFRVCIFMSYNHSRGSIKLHYIFISGGLFLYNVATLCNSTAEQCAELMLISEMKYDISAAVQGQCTVEASIFKDKWLIAPKTLQEKLGLNTLTL